MCALQGVIVSGSPDQQMPFARAIWLKPFQWVVESVTIQLTCAVDMFAPRYLAGSARDETRSQRCSQACTDSLMAGGTTWWCVGGHTMLKQRPSTAAQPTQELHTPR